MLDRLPPELLDVVLDLAMSSPPLFPNETARACCLVSRAVGQRARRLLWRDIRVSRDGGQRLLEQLQQPGMGEMAKLVRIMLTEAVDAETVCRILQCLPNVEEASLDYATGGGLKLPELAKIRTLRSLHIRHSWLVRLAPVSFPLLNFLALHRVGGNSLTSDKLFSVGALPSLTALVIEEMRDPNGEGDDGSYLPPLPSSLLDQLSFLRIRHNDLHGNAPLELYARDNLLLELDFVEFFHRDNAPPLAPALTSLVALRAPHLRFANTLLQGYCNSLDKARDALDALVGVLQHPCRPRTLHLCPSLLPHGEPLKAAVLRLLAVAANEDVRVVWQRQPGRPTAEVPFWREEMKEVESARRQAEELEAAEAPGGMRR
ncbi:hypothetical protein JCM10213_005061 [Rhodosporidiobolus nylandii]